MSRTMFLGRVVLPAIGLILAVVLSFQAVKSVVTRAGADSSRSPRPVAARSLSSRRRIVAEGRVAVYPGADVTVGTEVLATIAKMHAEETMSVRAGDLLVELRPDSAQASLLEARARLFAAEAQLAAEQIRSRFERAIPSLKARDGSPPEPQRDLSVPLAYRDLAKAEVERLECELAKFRILSPIDGVIVARHADPGETVAPAAPLVTIMDLRRLRVEAEVDEFDIARLFLKAKVTITAEGYVGKQWGGIVEEIANVVVGRQARPLNPGRPSDIRILPVRVKLLESIPLKVGQRVDVEIEVREDEQ